MSKLTKSNENIKHNLLHCVCYKSDLNIDGLKSDIFEISFSLESLSEIDE